MSQGQVFVSYRHDDTKGMAQAVYDRLLQSMRPDQVFLDTAGLAPGARFADELTARVRQCQVMLVLIDRRWAGGGEGGPSRLHAPGDWVRHEVALALAEGKRVVPVLIDGAALPPPEALPFELQSLPQAQAFALRSSRLDADTWDLAGHVAAALGAAWPPPEPGEKVHATLAMLYAILAGAMLLLFAVMAAFTDKVTWVDRAAMLSLGAAIAIVLRLPLIDELRLLSRGQALEYAAIAHMAFALLLCFDGRSPDYVMLAVFGVLPAAVLYFAAGKTRRLVRR